MSTKIEYEPGNQTMAVDEQVQTILNAFPKVGTPATRPDISAKLQFGDGVQYVVFYTQNDAQRHEIKYSDLVNDNDADKQIAHIRATELLNALAPRYFEHSVNSVWVFDESGNTVVALTFR
jgi:hypothetical protein